MLIITPATIQVKHVMLRLDRSIQFHMDCPGKKWNDGFKAFYWRSNDNGSDYIP